MEKCVILNWRPAGSELGILYSSVLSVEHDVDNAEARDVSVVHLPDDTQQVAILEGYQLQRTLDNHLLFYGPRSSRSPISVHELSSSCLHLLQVGSRAVIVTAVGDRNGFALKSFNIAALADCHDGLEFLGVRMGRFYSVSGRTVEGTRRSLHLAIAGRDFDVPGIAEYGGCGVLIVTIDSNNTLIDVAFRKMFTSYQTCLCLRRTELLVWREGDLGEGFSLQLDLEDDLEKVVTAEELSMVCGPSPLGGRNSNLLAEVDGTVLAVFQKMTRSGNGFSRPCIVCYRLDENRRWADFCQLPDSDLRSICVVL